MVHHQKLLLQGKYTSNAKIEQNESYAHSYGKYTKENINEKGKTQRQYVLGIPIIFVTVPAFPYPYGGYYPYFPNSGGAYLNQQQNKPEVLINKKPEVVSSSPTAQNIQQFVEHTSPSHTTKDPTSDFDIRHKEYVQHQRTDDTHQNIEIVNENIDKITKSKNTRQNNSSNDFIIHFNEMDSSEVNNPINDQMSGLRIDNDNSHKELTTLSPDKDLIHFKDGDEDVKIAPFLEHTTRKPIEGLQSDDDEGSGDDNFLGEKIDIQVIKTLVG